MLPENMGLVFKAASEGFAAPNFYPVEDRGLLLSFIFFMPKQMGQGQFYLLGLVDKDGKLLDGSKTYRLTVPANAPIASTGRRRCTTETRMRSFATCLTPPALRRTLGCRSTRTDQWTCTSDQSPHGARIELDTDGSKWEI